MGLRPRDGNMYDFITHSWNTIKGRCLHDCSYCYMKKRNDNLPKVHLDSDEFKTDLGDGLFIFVGSSIDLFANDIPEDWILLTLDHCYNANNKLFGEKNKYMFQSKNPRRIIDFLKHPVFQDSVICTTIETNKWIPKVMNGSPRIEDRVSAMEEIAMLGYKTYVTVEPIMQFDMDEMIECIRRCKPIQVNFGKNTNWKVRIPQPKGEKGKILIKKLIREVAKFTDKVVIKSNLQKGKFNQSLRYDHDTQKLVKL